jgi:hypothetical protein
LRVLALAQVSGIVLPADEPRGTRLEGQRERNGEAPRKALIVDLARADRRARDVGVYYLVRGLIVMPAALIGGLLWKVSPTLPFLVAFVVGLGALIAFGRKRP